MLYIFATFLGIPGQPGRVLNAGGVQFVVEQMEELAQLDHAGQATKEDPGTGYRISERLLDLGITWDWFPEKHAFGNGVTRHKTNANYQTRVVVSGTDLALNQYLQEHGVTRLMSLSLEEKHLRTEGWDTYERRWLPGTCPQENHEVHLTWIVAEKPVAEPEYQRIRDLVERGSEPLYPLPVVESVEGVLQAVGPGTWYSELRPYRPLAPKVPLGLA